MRTEKYDRQLIKTPEGVVFSMQLAGPAARFLAWLIDIMVTIMALVVIGFVGYFIIALMSLFSAVAEYLVGFLSIAFFIIKYGYHIWMEYRFNGQTLGKKMLGIRVVDEHGLKLRLSQVFLRNILRIVDSLPIWVFLPLGNLLGGAVMMLTRNNQRLGDIAANTIVVQNPPKMNMDLNKVLSDKYNSFSQSAHLVAKLKQNITAAEAQLALPTKGIPGNCRPPETNSAVSR